MAISLHAESPYWDAPVLNGIQNVANLVTGYAWSQVLSTFNTVPHKLIDRLRPPQRLGMYDDDEEPRVERWLTLGGLAGTAQDVASVVGAAAYCCGVQNEYTRLAAAVVGAKIATNVLARPLYSMAELMRKDAPALEQRT